MLQRIILFIFISFISAVMSQKEYTNWYFGNKAGIHFENNNYSIISTSSMQSAEASASISDKNGNILFYTNGEKVWNKDNLVMSNGYNLNGNQFSTQTAIIKQPLSPNLFYIFTLPAQNDMSISFDYSIVDIDLNAGLGNVTSSKNVLIQDSINEKICVVKHANNIDYWIIVLNNKNTTFYTYLLNEFGLTTVPIESHFTNTIQDSIPENTGQLKCNKQGNRIAAAFWGTNFIELFDFDNNTGVLTNPTIIDGFILPYGLEFSSDGNILYVSDMASYINSLDSSKIHQINLNAGSLSLVQASKKVINKSIKNLGQLQIGPNNRIYIANFTTAFLDIIENPNILDFGCQYQKDELYLVPKQSFYGLPNIPNDAYNYTYSSNNFCLGDFTSFEFHSSFTDSLLWSFGDKNSPINFSKDTITSHYYLESKDYTIKLIVYTHDFIDTIYDTIEIMISPGTSFLPNDTTICFNDSFEINLQDNNTDYVWSDGFEKSTRTIEYSGQYVVTAENECGISTDKIEVKLINCKTCALKIADAFTPNQDGLNDYFFPITEEGKEIVSFRIYNRWGKIVHSNKKKWDGKYLNTIQAVDEYFYTYTVNCNGEYKNFQGSFSLLK